VVSVGSAATKSTSQSEHRVNPERYSSWQLGQNNGASCATEAERKCRFLVRLGGLGMTSESFQAQ
ncbi:MAG TPA: hypothetical protein VLW83_04535, partial [Candidatus Acidoferrales bacterium]|nr:hypothetical protein [Candidatus Acidoferrales bacterium]